MGVMYAKRLNVEQDFRVAWTAKEVIELIGIVICSGRAIAFILLQCKSLKVKWYRWADLNRHARKQRILNPSCIPISPHRHCNGGELYCTVFLGQPFL